MRRKKSFPTIPWQGRGMALFCLLLFSLVELHAREQQIRISPAEHYQEHLSRGVQLRPGLGNQTALSLADEEYQPDGSTDLLLHFNEDVAFELLRTKVPYGLQQDGSQVQELVRYKGEGAALFLPGTSLDLMAAEGSMFSPGDVWGDFTIEFWMYPAAFDDRQELFLWKGSAWMGDVPVVQEFSIESHNGRLQWNLENIFMALSPDEEGVPQLSHHRFQLSSRAQIIPRRWSHHLLRYDSSEGILEYLRDGVTEDLVYATGNGRPGSAPLLPRVGDESDRLVRIGTSFEGFLDELRISRSWVEKPQLRVIPSTPGYAVIGPIDLKSDSARLISLSPQVRTPGLTDVRLSLFHGDGAPLFNQWSGEPVAGAEGWVSLDGGWNSEVLSQLPVGRYLYLLMEFLPDGSGEHIPLVQEITISYEDIPPPPAPGGLSASASDRSVLLEWNPVISRPVEGYLLYYGDAPGSYFGEDSALGVSPVDLGNVTEVEIEGLTNGKMYYFRVASYNEYNHPSRGLYRERNISQEVYARPSRNQP